MPIGGLIKGVRFYLTITRFLLINRAGRINWANGVKVLQMTKNKSTEALYDKISESLSQIEFKKAA
jgi:hypothetical protein